jgi:outer membrane protein assembly factor BamB
MNKPARLLVLTSFALAAVAACLWLLRAGPAPEPDDDAFPPPAAAPDDGAPADPSGGLWPGWRGPGGTGVAREAPDADVPFESARVIWKAGAVGAGNSSPVVWGDRVVLTAADGSPDSLRRALVMAFDRASGRPAWRTAVPAPRRPAKPPSGNNGWATPTPACNGRRLVAVFATGTVACLGLNGALAWTHDLGPIDHLWGLAASPAIDDRRAYVAVDQGKESSAPSFVIAIDLASGAPAWRTEIAPSGGRGYSTPVLLRDGDASALVLWAGDRLSAFDAQTGRPLWQAPTFAELEPVATPLPAGDLLVLAQSDRAAAWRIRRAGRIAAPETAWTLFTEAGARFARIAASVAYRGRLYGVSEEGTAWRYDAATGAPRGSVRLGGTFFAAPVAAGGRVIFTGRDGTLHVLKAGDRLERAGTLAPGGRTDASPAVAEGRLYVRTRREDGGTVLWCLGNDVAR